MIATDAGVKVVQQQLGHRTVTQTLDWMPREQKRWAGQRLLPGDVVYLVVADPRPRCYELEEC